MALPPIIANNPIIKLFQTGQKNASPKDAVPPEAKTGAAPQDIVNISGAALRKLASAQVSPLETDEAAQQTAHQVRGALAGDETQTLGLDPGFAG